MLKNKFYLKKFMKEFFNLSEIGDIENISYYNDVKTMDKEEAEKAGLYIVIGKDVDDAAVDRL